MTVSAGNSVIQILDISAGNADEFLSPFATSLAGGRIEYGPLIGLAVDDKATARDGSVGA